MVNESEIEIWTVIPYFSNGIDINTNGAATAASISLILFCVATSHCDGAMFARKQELNVWRGQIPADDLLQRSIKGVGQKMSDTALPDREQ